MSVTLDCPRRKCVWLALPDIYYVSFFQLSTTEIETLRRCEACKDVFSASLPCRCKPFDFPVSRLVRQGRSTRFCWRSSDHLRSYKHARKRRSGFCATVSRSCSVCMRMFTSSFIVTFVMKGGRRHPFHPHKKRWRPLSTLPLFADLHANGELCRNCCSTSNRILSENITGMSTDERIFEFHAESSLSLVRGRIALVLQNNNPLPFALVWYRSYGNAKKSLPWVCENREKSVLVWLDL